MRSLLVLSSLFVILVTRVSAATMVSVVFTPDTVVGGVASAGTITLDGAAPGTGIVIALTSNNPAAVVPASITIPAGQTTVTFSATTSSVTNQALVTVTASVGGASKTGTLTLNPVFLSTVTLNPPTILVGGATTGTVTLSGPAPSGGAKVTLTSTHKEAPVPATVTVPAGQTSVTFSIPAKFVSSPTTVTIGAVLDFVETNATLTVDPIGPSTVTLNPASVNGKGASVGTVTVFSPAPAGGMTIDLASTSGVAKLPRSVKIKPGESTVTFPITTAPVSVSLPIQISSRFGSVVVSTGLTVQAPVITTAVFTPASVVGGSPSNAVLTLSFEAPPGGLTIALTSDIPNVTLPPTLVIPAGKTTGTFTMKTTPIAAAKPANIKTVLNGAGPTVPLTLTPPTLASIKLIGTSVVTPESISGVLNLNSPAPDGGLTIPLLTNVPAATPPGSVLIAAGRTSVKFTIKTQKVKADTPVTITAVLNGVSVTVTFTMKPPVATESKPASSTGR